jgi:thiol-disulfide isomerase/thioredoxin
MGRIVALAVFVVTACSSGESPKPAARPPSPFETFAETSPKVGEVAPPFTLSDTAGATMKLSEAVAAGPVVLVSGSFSCPLFRMKAPRFEDLARRWAGKATVLFVYSEEAHPRAAASERLNGFADQVKALDKDGDNAVTVAEYGTFGPRYMFDAFDVDRDGIVRSHEIIAARRIDQFAQIDAPRTLEERIALARRFRAEVPGTIRVLIDPLDNPTAKTYGELPNFAYVIGADGRVVFKQGWAAVKDVERELQKLTGLVPAAPAPPDLSLLAAAQRTGKPVLVELTAPGCAACERMTRTLADPAIASAMARFEVVRLSVDQDPAWRLLEDLDLAATPAFVRLGTDGAIGERRQGEQSKDAFIAFLQ